MRNTFSVKIPLLALLFLVLVSNVHADEYIQITAVLMSYEQAHWHPHELDIVDEHRIAEGTITADSVCPKARFKVINPQSKEEVLIDIIFLYREIPEKLKSELATEGSLGSTFYVEFPDDFFEEDFGWIYFDSIGNIEKKA